MSIDDMFASNDSDAQQNTPAQTGASSNLDAQPLAARMRPQTLGDYVGQTHIVGENTPLALALASGQLYPFILWGEPGTGKTTLASIVSHTVSRPFVQLSAVTSGVADIRRVISQAKDLQTAGQLTPVLFIDEIHRFNKSQQDALLPHVESGLLLLIGATTENPSFEVNNALLSRVKVYHLKPLSNDELVSLLRRAIEKDPLFDDKALSVDSAALEYIASRSAGDARAALSWLERAASYCFSQRCEQLTESIVSRSAGSTTARFDKFGDHLYDQISALHKAVRGSAPDAALYWLARMLEGGADVNYLARRLLRMAHEDIGLADPRAVSLAIDSWETITRLGSPEGDLALATTTVYLASAPKSNAVYKAFNEARSLAKQFSAEAVPNHIRNAPTQLMKEDGAAEDYRYAHNYDNQYVAGESYMPEKLKDIELYQPVNAGLESRIQAKLKEFSKLDRESDWRRYE